MPLNTIKPSPFCPRRAPSFLRITNCRTAKLKLNKARPATLKPTGCSKKGSNSVLGEIFKTASPLCAKLNVWIRAIALPAPRFSAD